MTGTYEAPTGTNAPSVGGGAIAVIGTTTLPTLKFKDMTYSSGTACAGGKYVTIY